MSEPWEKFRVLCKYYADCIKYSEHSQEYLFPDQLNKTFMIPRLPTNWHLKEEKFVVETEPKDAFVRSELLNAADEDELFLGYPLNAFISPTGTECLCPILMFPVSITVRGAGFTTGIKMKIDRQGISINQDWIDYHIPRSEQKAFRRACERTEDEMGCVDVEMVLCYLSNHFKTVPLNPNGMQFSICHSHAKKCILNTAVLFEGTKTKYTKNLITELHRIAREPDAILDKTALAYVFREPCLTQKPAEEKRIPASFMSRALNAGQFDAVEKALNNPIAKVMGPPGTGKSFMSVNLIANEVLHGGSVLFTSKNHKAIHAIYDKVSDAIEDKDLPLVSFCTTPDNLTNADWQKSQKDVDIRLDKLEAKKHSKVILKNAATSELDVWLSMYRDAESHIERYQKLREQISRYEQLLVQLESSLQELSENNLNTDERISILKERAKLLMESPRQPMLQRIMAFFYKLVRCEKLKLDMRTQLGDVAPRVANAIASNGTALKEIRRLLRLLKVRKLIKKWEEAEYEALREEQSKINFEELKSDVKKALNGAREVVQQAYEEKLLSQTKNIAQADTVVDRCKVASEEVLMVAPLSIDDVTKYDKALVLYREYLKVFPAWASTMLSLKRAAPCLPGVFSLVIIDEASQCEVPPMIPALFRAQRAAIIGDPNQFPPVITLKESKDRVFRRKYHIEDLAFNKFAFRWNNTFSVVHCAPVLLNEHFRCADEIAEYFNGEFYDKQLVLCCERGRSGESAVGALKPGMMWKDAEGGDKAEIEAAIEYLRELKRQAFTGSIGIISPLRNLVNQLKTIVADRIEDLPSQLNLETQINTANGFQGGECDVILFLLGLNEDRSHGQDWYITAPENKYIYNVSVSRAKQLFVAFGNKERVKSCGLSYIQKLIPKTRTLQKAKIGPGEDRLRIALERAGIKVAPQYPVLGRYLDLAIPEKKVDIEVDGQAWHLDSRGCRKADDIHRDVQLEASGWHVIRFWHHEVITDINVCVNKIRQLVADL